MKEETPGEKLCRAIFDGDTVEALYLISTGANVDWVDAYGYTPLTLAANDSCMEEVLRELIAQGANVNLPANDGMHPFELALGRKDIAVAGELIRHGAYVDKKTMDYYTALKSTQEEEDRQRAAKISSRVSTEHHNKTQNAQNSLRRIKRLKLRPS